MKRIGIWLLSQLLLFSAAGQHKLSGIVTGAGEPLPGASVIIEDSFLGVSAKSDGSFEFNNLKAGEYRLTASFIGFENQTIKVEIPAGETLVFNLEEASIVTEEVLVSATRAKSKTPVAYNNLTAEDISSKNMGQDIPYLLQLTPSFVATSDAGAGVGYSYFRIRGTDMNRINVTVNGVPLNDPESHGTWFVDQPDLASSLENAQIQRGVGTSVNGAAAFGASINLQTNLLRKKPYADYKTSAGSFNTFKNTVSAGTGLINERFSFDARLSKVTSDGFVDRSFSDLKSFFITGGYYSGNTVLKANVFSGIQTTYQSWNGVPSVRLNNDTEGMLLYGEHGLYTAGQTREMIESNSRTYNLYTYKNQIDYYQQDHYQLHLTHKFNRHLHLNVSGFYIRGKGYYENYRYNRKPENYRLPEIIIEGETVKRIDLIDRKWLDNHFYGSTYSLNYQKGKSDLIVGGGFNKYDGGHYGNVLWTQYSVNVSPDHEWYKNDGIKKDFNLFVKYNFQLSEEFTLFADMQFRRINYLLTGIDDDLRDIGQEHNFSFPDPKLGINWQPAGNQKLFLSFGKASREPNRYAYTDNREGTDPPVFEILYDWETGYEYRMSGFSANVNLYWMNYKDQLVLTGEINDVGNPRMVNVEKSYRRGIELQAGLSLTRNLKWIANATFSRNKIKNFTEYIDNWDTGEQEQIFLGTTDIAFSPNVIAGSQLLYEPLKKLNIGLLSSYVGKQYVDNTSGSNRMLNAYFVSSLNADYSVHTGLFDKIVFRLMINNIFNSEYESNAWVYSYLLGGERYKMDGYFPQAGRHFIVGIDLSF